MAFAATTLYVIFRDQTFTKVTGVTNLQRLPADPTLANSDPLTKAYLFAEGGYRDDKHLGANVAFASVDDGAVSSGGTVKGRLPDSVMHVPWRNKVALHSCYVLTCGDGPVLEFKCADVRAISNNPLSFASSVVPT